MEMIYNLTYHNGSTLRLQIHTQSSVDYAKVSDNLFTHGEYETTWDEKSQEWTDKGYYSQCSHERYKGNSDVIFLIYFSGVNRKLLSEFVPAIEAYFECMKWDTVKVVETKLISELQSN
jgi:hypothetical protein